MNKNKNLNLTMNLRQTNKQKGFTLWSFMFTAAVVIFCIYIGALLVPVYSADSAIKNALNASLENVKRENVRKKEIIKAVDKRLYIDGIYEGPDMKKVLFVKKEKAGTTVTIDYKKEVPLFYNIGMYLDFKHEVVK